MQSMIGNADSWSMAFNSQCLVLLNRIYFMKEKLPSMGVGLSIQFAEPSKNVSEKEFFSSTEKLRYSAEFSNLVRLVGYRRALKSLIVRYRYIVRLWLVRESAIIRILSQNVEKTPRWSISRLCARVYNKFAIVRRWLWSLEQQLNKNNI